MLRTRIAVAAVGLPLLALLLAVPEPLFGAFVAAVLAFAAFELMRAAAPDAGYPTALSAGVAVAALAAMARALEGFELWTLLPALALALAWLLPPSRTVRWPGAAWWVMAVLYAGALGGHFLLLRNLVDGHLWLVVVFAGTFATDTGAYAAGRLLGRHRLAPRLSPGKTWEGAAGGLAAGAAGAVAAIALSGLSPAAGAVATMAVALPVAAMAGDLLESAIKRRVDVKDMSQLIPGHGGLLDRLDSLLLTGPLLYWLVRWFAT